MSAQNCHFDVCVVDSSSIDGTAEVARASGAIVHEIPVTDFNHGGTRQLMVDINKDYDTYVFLTQDAYLDNPEGIQNIVAPFEDKEVGAVCGRQLPHLDASPLASHARLFNYPAGSSIKTLDDSLELGIKTPFISNSFAAYRREALCDTGGFPKHVILSEDMYVAAKMLIKGWKIAYAGNASVHHSHNYSIFEEFKRYFDIGVFHARESWIREQFGQAGGEGKRYVFSELRFLGLKRLYLWPSSFVRNGFKFIGYKFGLNEKWLPLGLKKIVTMHRGFWNGPYA